MTATSLWTWARATMLSAENVALYVAGVFTGVLLVYPPGTAGFGPALTMTTVVMGLWLAVVIGLAVGMFLMHAAHVLGDAMSDSR